MSELGGAVGRWTRESPLALQYVCVFTQELMNTGWGKVFGSELTWPLPRRCEHFNLFGIIKYFYELL